MKLYKSDIDAIERDRVLRRMGAYSKPRTPDFETKPNEYLEFLDKCASHAYRVGDDYIARKIRLEFWKWEEADESNDDATQK